LIPTNSTLSTSGEESMIGHPSVMLRSPLSF
jgi:hypothetical protein